MNTVIDKYQASKKIIEKINVSTPILLKLKKDEATNYREAKKAFERVLCREIIDADIRDYAQINSAVNVYCEKLGILTGIWYARDFDQNGQYKW